MKTTAFFIAAISTAAVLSAAGPSGQNTYYYQPSQQDSNFKQTPRTITDDEIAKNVHTILAGNWMHHGYPDVTFDVNNGTVNLRGIVHNREDKMKVEQAIRKLEGVNKVNNDISIGMKPAQANKPLAWNDQYNASSNTTTTTTPPTMSTSMSTKDSAATEKDRHINMRIRERLNRLSPRGYETIIISTSNGAVIISGNLERVEDIQKVSHEAKHVDGVKNVTNQISIKKQSY